MAIHIDFETRSQEQLKSSGIWRYAEHPSTSVLCMAYRVDDGEVKLWVPGESRPPELIASLESGKTVKAFNVSFEKAIWRKIMIRDFGFPDIPNEQWSCVAAKCAAHALPRKLEDAAKALSLSQLKDEEGKRIMMKLSKPRKETKTNKSLWHETNQDFQTLFSYCRQDVEVESLLDKEVRDLSPQEFKLWQLDQKINERGIMVDMPLVEAALKVSGEYVSRLTAELPKLTNGEVESGGEIDRIMFWLNSNGVPMTDLTKDSVEELLKSTSLKSNVRRVLEIRQELGKTSVKKYAAIKNAVCSDGRLRNLLLYHGASTGRWTGMTVQPQNFPRNTIENTDEAIKVLKTGRLDAFQNYFPRVLDTLSSLLRSVFIASPGHTMHGGDYSAIEARVIFWLAGEEQGLRVFERGDDIYVDLAKVIYPGSEIDKAKRDLGKRGILGCLARGTKVYSDSGIKLIEEVTTEDKLWNGYKFEKHGGLLKVGSKPVIYIKRLNLWSTYDHLFLTKDGWRTAEEIALNPRIQPHLSEKDSVYYVSSARSLKKVLNVMSVFAAAANLRRVLESTNSGAEKLRHAVDVLHRGTVNLEETPIEQVILSLTRDYAHGSLHAGIIYVKDANIRMIKTSTGMVVEGSTWASGIADTSWRTLLNSMVGTTGTRHSIELIIPEDIDREISEWSANRKTIETKVEECYDILSVGVDNMFQAGRGLAHNCGYGMGHKKFKETCENFGQIIEQELAERVVATYRQKYYPVVKFWYAQEAAAIEAVQTGQIVKCGKITWGVHGRFLYAKLPSGRCLAYFDPRIAIGETPWGEKKSQLSYMAVNSVTRKWERERTYGGKIAENCLDRDTLVLTMRGCVPIVEVTSEDKVWDGANWVTTGGVVNRGIKPTGKLGGLGITADHLILVGDSWKSAISMDEDSWHEALKPGLSSVACALSEVALENRASLLPNVLAAINTVLKREDCYVTPGNVPPVGTQKPVLSGKNIKASCLKNFFLFGFTGTRGWSADAITRRLKHIKTMVDVGLRSIRIGCGIVGRFLNSLKPFRGGGTNPLTWIGSTTVKDTFRGTSDSVPEKLTAEIAETLQHFGIKTKLGRSWTSGKNGVRVGGATMPSLGTLLEERPRMKLWRDTGKLTEVFDLLNCGPNNRFTVVSKNGLVIVHNCTQAVARDIMASAMLTAELHGYKMLLSVHDELIAELPDSQELRPDFEKIMTTKPEWAEGLPVNAEVWYGSRYEK